MFACRSDTGASWKAVFLWALLLWVLALAVRLPGTGRDAPQTDELSWMRRSGRIISLIKAGNFSEATSFLWHPGIVPALVMATGQVSAKLIKRAIRPEAGADVQIDALRVSRISCALVSSLAPAILFLLLNLAVGWQAAIIGGMLAALDVQQVAYGRIAHLDGVFSVLVLLTISTYWYAVERNSLSAKVGAGIFWGLALATRTFAVVLIPIFFIYKLLRMMLLPAQGDRGDRSLLSISDIWTVLIGQTLMTSIFTRMRHYPSDYKLYLWEENSAADWIYAAGSALQGHAWLVFCFVLSGLGLLWLRSRRVEQGTPSRERRMAAFWWGLAAGYIVLTLTAFPAQ
ncbi:MAG: glycosyltransferase family 39 protein, partial [Deltaproteobacteria bacterium]|nr:glycosyltransferase family 39 protein [Deltaproteobacteria bacterium]